MDLKNKRHDLVGLLHAIRSLAECHIQKDKESCFQDVDQQMGHAKEVLGRIYMCTEQALKITKRLGRSGDSLSEQTSGYLAPVKSLSRFTCEIVDGMRSEGLLDDIAVVTRIPLEFPMLQCSRDDLFEILFILIHNSAMALKTPIKKAVGERKEFQIVIRAEITLTESQRLMACLTVADNGPGILGSQIPHIFRPFFTTKDSQKGNGLGLYLVKELVAQNGGLVRVSSYDSCGASFQIQLPLLEEKNDRNITLRGSSQITP